MIPQNNHQSIAEVTTFYCKTDVFKYSYFPHTILEWNKLDMQIRRPEYLLAFKIFLLEMGRPTDKPTFNIHQATGLKFLTSLRLRLSFFNKHNFKYNFQDWVNTLCSHSFQIAVMQWAEKFSKFVSPDTLKMDSLAMSLLRFLRKTLFKLLKLSLQKTLLWMIFKKPYIVRAAKQYELKRCSK